MFREGKCAPLGIEGAESQKGGGKKTTVKPRRKRKKRPPSFREGRRKDLAISLEKKTSMEKGRKAGGAGRSGRESFRAMGGGREKGKKKRIALISHSKERGLGPQKRRKKERNDRGISKKKRITRPSTPPWEGKERREMKKTTDEY